MPRSKGSVLRLPTQVDYSKVSAIFVPYRRVSTREQAMRGAGLDAQRTALGFGLQMREATALTWDCVDKGKSGKNLKRPFLTEAIELIRAGNAGGIMVSKLDRLSRSLLDFAYLMMTAEKEGWNIVALDVGIDLATPAGKMMAGILAIFAEFERNVISQRTKDGLAEKMAQGVKVGRPSNIHDDLLRAICAAYSSDPNYSAVARWLNEAGVPTAQGGRMWYPMVVSKVVNSPAGRAVLTEYEEAAA